MSARTLNLIQIKKSGTGNHCVMTSRIRRWSNAINKEMKMAGQVVGMGPAI
jgi:hypothetical protein